MGKQELDLSRSRQINLSNFLEGIKIAKIHELTHEYLKQERDISFKVMDNNIKFLSNQMKIKFGYTAIGAIAFTLIFLFPFPCYRFQFQRWLFYYLFTIKS